MWLFLFCGLWTFALGLAVGSFLNVLIARLPYEMSVFWPGSRCFTCRRPLRLTDNLPILGYLRLRGRCRFCGATFSARYLWVEVGTGAAFVALFVLTLGVNWHGAAGVVPMMTNPFHFPTLGEWLYFGCLAVLLAGLIASAVIDLRYRIIPGQITYVGTLIGVIAATAFAWPWPASPAAVPVNPNWANPFLAGPIPLGLTLWPVFGPLPDGFPPESWQLGLLNAVAGAAAGQLTGRAINFLFGVGFGRDSVGLGDADLLMMIGAFLGWQAAVLSLPAGAVILLPIVLTLRLWFKLRGRSTRSDMHPDDDPTALPFGPGIAVGAVVCWLGWPRYGELVRVLAFDPTLLVVTAGVMAGGFVVAGQILRRPAE